MISNQILQETLDGVKAITKVDLIVMDLEGRPLAKTVDDAALDYEDAVMAFAESQAESQSLLGYQFFKINDDKQLEYVLMAGGDSDNAYMVGKIGVSQLQSLIIAYKERRSSISIQMLRDAYSSLRQRQRRIQMHSRQSETSSLLRQEISSLQLMRRTSFL